MIDLLALERACVELKQQPATDDSGEGPRTVVSLGFLEQVLDELVAGRAAQAKLGQTFGLPKGQTL